MTFTVRKSNVEHHQENRSNESCRWFGKDGSEKKPNTLWNVLL